MTLPDSFIKMLDGLGPEYAALPDTLLSTAPSAAVRLNRAKCARYGLTPAVAAEGRTIAWCEDGVLLAERPAFTLDPALHQGLYYVQDASSMAIAAAVAKALSMAQPDGRPIRYLDACAAPGGKTTAALSILPDNAFVVANEFDPRRASVLIENLSKWGRPAVVTVSNAAEPRHLPEFFDIIAADVPCSGEGMMRKDPQAVAQWTPGLVESCARLQRDIVDSLWEALAPGGCLVYSTCTFNSAENEAVVQYLIDTYRAQPIEIESLQRPEILGTSAGYSFPAYHFLPGMVEGEGQFIALLRKPEDAPAGKSLRNVKPPRASTDLGLLEGDFSYFTDKNGRVTASPTGHQPLISAVTAAGNVRAAGVDVATVKGRDIIPEQSLAMSLFMRPGIYPTAEVDLETALNYLRRQTITLPPDTPRGHVLLTHNTAPLGFVKHLGNRTNNLYPPQWRILK